MVQSGVGPGCFSISIQANAASAEDSERVRAAARTFDGTQSVKTAAECVINICILSRHDAFTSRRCGLWMDFDLSSSRRIVGWARTDWDSPGADRRSK